MKLGSSLYIVGTVSLADIKLRWGGLYCKEYKKILKKKFFNKLMNSFIEVNLLQNNYLKSFYFNFFKTNHKFELTNKSNNIQLYRLKGLCDIMKIKITKTKEQVKVSIWNKQLLKKQAVHSVNVFLEEVHRSGVISENGRDETQQETSLSLSGSPSTGKVRAYFCLTGLLTHLVLFRRRRLIKNTFNM